MAVVGAGNVAMDAARTALRLGAQESIIIYRRSEDEMQPVLKRFIMLKRRVSALNSLIIQLES